MHRPADIVSHGDVLEALFRLENYGYSLFFKENGLGGNGIETDLMPWQEEMFPAESFAEHLSEILNEKLLAADRVRALK